MISQRETVWRALERSTWASVQPIPTKVRSKVWSTAVNRHWLEVNSELTMHTRNAIEDGLK